MNALFSAKLRMSSEHWLTFFGLSLEFVIMSKLGLLLMSGALALTVSSQAVTAQTLKNITQSELNKLKEITKEFEGPHMDWYPRYNKPGERKEQPIAINNISVKLYMLVAKVGERRIRLLNTPQAGLFRGTLTGYLNWNTPPRQLIAKSAAAALTAAGIAELRESKVERVEGGVLRAKDVAGMHVPGRWTKDIEDIHQAAKWKRETAVTDAEKYFLKETSLDSMAQNYWNVLSPPSVLNGKGLRDQGTTYEKDLKKLISSWFAMSLAGSIDARDHFSSQIEGRLKEAGVPEGHRISVHTLLLASPIASKQNLEKYFKISNELYHTGYRFALRDFHDTRSRAARIWYFADRANVPLE